MTPQEQKKLLYRKLNALHLEVDGSIVDDIKQTVDALFAPAPAQGVEEAILALQKAIQMAEHDNEDPLATSWPEQTGVLISLSDAKKLLAGPRWQQGRPKVVCYCGSIRKALNAFKKAEYESLMRGEIALLPCCMFVDIEREYGAGSEYKQKADEQHKRKIDMCDEVFVLNVGGYIGESTRSEIEYANKIGKPVKYLES